MSTLMTKGLSVTLIFLAIFMASQAQKDGNIVEYFGREVVEEINEGAVVHIFSKGLLLPAASQGRGLMPETDIIAWHFANETWTVPEEGQLLHPAHNKNDSAFIWQAVEVNEENSFQGRMLRRSFLYTPYPSAREEVLLLDAWGHTQGYFNGKPFGGDHYDFGYTLVPVKLKKGLNEFIYTPGRFGRITAKLVAPAKPVMLTIRDMTVPSLIAGETEEQWAAVRVINTLEKELAGLTIHCILETGEEAVYKTDRVMELSVRKVKFRIPATTVKKEDGKVQATLVLTDGNGKELHRISFELSQHEAGAHHERTFVSNIDGSVQYYSVAPSTEPGANQALVLSVHGAGVEARNQSRAYSQKDWCHVVAPTNRRPYGFNWEDWGRTDALEVLEEAKKVFRTDLQKTYLTGHSMGGHGTWQIGVTYPDKFAAIAPCAGYADILGYGRSEQNSLVEDNLHYRMLQRSANGGRTLKLKRNYLQSGIYILHGSEDRVVPTEQARMMRDTLGSYHPDFCYYEYPGGSHWYSNESVDWEPLFSYFRWHSIPELKDVGHIEFHTASPGISATNYWITIHQQEKPLEFSSVDFKRHNDTITGNTANAAALEFHLAELDFKEKPVIVIDGQILTLEGRNNILLKKVAGQWKPAVLNPAEKTPERNGGFKNAFGNRVVFVYATGGSPEENDWYRNKARFDAETFQYKANGSIEVLSDRTFKPENYPDRNVVLYGNADNNRAWKLVLDDVPVVIKNGEILFGDNILKGDDMGAFYIYPRSGSGTASVGIVAGTGIKGMKTAFTNNYFAGFNGYPDLLIFDTGYIKEGVDGILVSGFFNNLWEIEKGNFSFTIQ
jgi:predicted esterase